VVDAVKVKNQRCTISSIALVTLQSLNSIASVVG
jgi:hypothetical protein